MSLIIGRCYGGASVLAMPKMFGSYKTFVLKNANIGIIHKQIISSLFKNSPNLLEEWEEVNKTEAEDCSDIIDATLVDAVINADEINSVIDSFILDAYYGKQMNPHLQACIHAHKERVEDSSNHSQLSQKCG